MASNYNSLGFQLMTTGEKAGTWGTETNTTWNEVRDTLGYITVAMTADRTLTIPDGSTGTYDGRAMIIECNGALGANRVLDIAVQAGSGSSPGGAANIEKPFIVFNNTSTAYSLTFKVTGATGFELAQGATYLCYHNGTDIVNSGLIGAATTDTLTNKTLTAPKFADGGFIADTTGAETLVFGEVTDPLNEVKITNAATGTAGPIIASQGQTNVNLQLRPAGSGVITVGSSAANATLTSKGAHDLILSTNEGTSSGTITITDASNGNIALAPEGTGEVLVGSGSAAGDITSSGAYDLIIDTNSGTNAGNITLTDGADGDIDFTTNGAGFLKFNDAAYNPETTLTDEATITWDAQAKPITAVTLTANRDLAAPTNGIAGAFISILVIQDAGGTNTLAWNAVFEFPSETAPTLTSTGALADLFVFRYHNSKWLQVGSTLALTVA
jgi:hypothetical protein